MKKLAIFDLDGTLLNTLSDLKHSLNYSLRANGFPEHTEENVRRFVGNGIYKLVERGVPQNSSAQQTDKVFRIFREYYTKHCCDNTKPYPDILNMLNELKMMNCFTAVVSNKADNAVQILCRKFFCGLIDYSVGERAGIRRKPSPDAIFDVLEHFGVSVEEAVYIGDSEVDIETAANLELDSISVSWGFRGKEFLLDCGAVNVIDDPKEIILFMDEA